MAPPIMAASVTLKGDLDEAMAVGRVGLWIIAGWAWHAVAGEIPVPPVEPGSYPPHSPG